MGISYVVVNEYALGVMHPSSARFVEVLAAHPTKGSPYTLDPGLIPTPKNPDNIRPATLNDFAAYRVSPVGHLVDRSSNPIV